MTSIQSPWVASKVWWNSEFSWDGVVLEYSTDGGTTWAEIGLVNDPVNWYNDSTINGLVAAGNSGHGWTGRASSNNGSGGFVPVSHDIGFLGGTPNVRFRFHFGSDASVPDDGFAFDNFAIAELPAVTLGNDTVVCDSVVLDPGYTTGTFLWSTQDTTPTITVTSSATVTLVYTDQYCLVGRDTINVSVNPTPTVDLGPDQNVCVGDSFCLNLDPNVYPNATWTGNVTGPQYCITTAGTFNVQVLDSVGCPSGDTINTALIALPTPNLGPDTTVCTGDTICLDPGCPPTHSFTWSNGATTSSICPTILSGYWVICTDSNNCSAADSIVLAPGPAAPVATAGVDTSNCPTIQFNDNSTGTIGAWTWDFGDGNTSTSQNPTNNYQPSGNGTYTVSLIVDNQCASDTTTFTVDITCLVAIGEGLDDQLYVWPNPNQGQFRIETVLSGNAPVRLAIVNLQGQVVYERNYEYASGSFTEDINLNNAAKGVYFVRFDVGGVVKMEKIVVE
jgi:PKD repeat protein